jgi:hypothetical protein
VYQRLLHSLKVAQSGPLTGLQRDFEHRVRDLALQWSALPPVTLTAAKGEFMALLVLEAGDGIIRLRELAGRLERNFQWKIDYTVSAIVPMLAGNDAQNIEQPLARLKQIYQDLVRSQKGQPGSVLALVPSLAALHVDLFRVCLFISLFSGAGLLIYS